MTFTLVYRAFAALLSFCLAGLSLLIGVTVAAQPLGSMAFEARIQTYFGPAFGFGACMFAGVAILLLSLRDMRR